MSYTALYRKYRPSNFNSVAGQQTVKRILVNSIKQNKISHAYLFSGPHGTGKTSVAKIFAKAVNCQDFKDDLCLKCDMCKALNENDTDIIEIDAASNNGVEEIRTIRNNVKLLPSIATYKVYIIDEVHMLSASAFNALLKTLEEPPKHVIFILATTEVSKIPLTILSRCQRFDFKKISHEIMFNQLKYICENEKKIVAEDVLNLIVEMSDGCARDAINLLDQVLTYNDKEMSLDDLYLITGDIPKKDIYTIFNNIVYSEFKQCLELINDFYETGKDISRIIDKLLLLVRDISINNNVSDYFKNEKAKELNQYKFLSDEQLLIITETLNNLSSNLKRTNNQKIIVEVSLINLSDKLGFHKKNSNDSTKINLHEETNAPIDVKDFSQEKTQEKNLTNNLQQIDKIKKIRVNNALATASKEYLKSALEKIELINEYISNKDYSNLVSILGEGKLMVASSKYLLFTYNNKSYVTMFYDNITKIENFLKEVLDNDYFVCAISNEEWEKEKKEFIDNKKNGKMYSLLEDTKIKISNNKKKSKIESEAIDIFGEDTVKVK